MVGGYISRLVGRIPVLSITAAAVMGLSLLAMGVAMGVGLWQSLGTSQAHHLPDQPFHYFAYGSNLLSARIRISVPLPGSHFSQMRAILFGSPL